jgi:hypothetical protein
MKKLEMSIPGSIELEGREESRKPFRSFGISVRGWLWELKNREEVRVYIPF